MVGQAEAEQLRIEGFTVGRQLLSIQQISSLDQLVSSHFRRSGVIYRYGFTQPHASVAMPGLQWLFTHGPVLDAYRKLLDSDPMWTGHADAHEGMGFGWHRDSDSLAEGSYFGRDHFVPDCRVIKAGVYLQDHESGGGLTVRPGSHREPTDLDTPGVHIASRIGDVVFFDVRLQHRGEVYASWERLAIRAGRRLGDQGNRSRVVARARAAVKKKPKRSIFFTFGLPNDLTDAFARSNMRRQEAQSGICGNPLPRPLEVEFARNAVRVAPCLSEKSQ